MTAHRCSTKERRLRRGAARLAAALVVLGGTGLSWGTLCLGEDGHVAVEVAVAGRCLDDAAAAPPAESTAGLIACDTEPCCGPCTDLGNTSAWLGTAVSARPDATPALASASPAAVATHLAAAPTSVIVLRDTPVARLAAETTVLRC